MKLDEIAPGVSASGPSLRSCVAEVLSSTFATGLRPASVIDQNRFRRAYLNSFGIEFPMGASVEKLLREVGLEQDGKVFPVPQGGANGWKKLIGGLISKGHRIFMFSRVMALHAQELIAAGVPSEEMLRRVICKDCAITKSDSQAGNGHLGIDVTTDAENWFAPRGEELDFARVIRNELSEGMILVDEGELRARYPYVEPDEIHRVLCSDGRFIRNDTKRFAVSDLVVFDNQEIATVLEWCRTEIERDGYCSLARLNLPESRLLNEGVSETALRRIFASRFLGSDYSLHGQIVAPKGAFIDSKVPVREFCRTSSEVTLEQIRQLNREYNIAEMTSIGTLNEEMVRVDADRFVSPSLVPFDVKAIDQAIKAGCNGKYRPLKGLVDFSSFPAVPGYVWNVYLLESFLRRASDGYVFLTLCEGSLNPTGALFRCEVKDGQAARIVLKSLPQKFRTGLFVKVVAHAALQAGVNPEFEIVGDFCVREGYIQRRGARIINQILAQMRALSMEKKG